MSDNWIQISEQVLNQIKDMENIENIDRLELVCQVRFTLGALMQSLLGWMQWLDNPDIMSRFDQGELTGINKTIRDFTKSFIKYDIEVTNKGIQKGISEKDSQRRTTNRSFYT
jgi:hypothetical protein